MKKESLLFGVERESGLLLSPPLKGGRGDVALISEEEKMLPYSRTTKPLAAGIEKKPNGRRGVVVVSHSPQTDFRRAVQSTKTDSGLHCGFLQFVCEVSD